MEVDVITACHVHNVYLLPAAWPVVVLFDSGSAGSGSAGVGSVFGSAGTGPTK